MKWHRDYTGHEDRGLRSGASGALHEEAMEFSLEELAEFLEADLAEVEVDREFKQTLRERLWDLVQARNRLRRGGPSRT